MSYASCYFRSFLSSLGNLLFCKCDRCCRLTEAMLILAYRWTFGSILFLSSWAILQGPRTYGAHLLSGPRLPFTAAYFGSIILTLYFSLGVRPVCTWVNFRTNGIQLQSTILTLLAAIGQLGALLWYLISYFPMGSQGTSQSRTYRSQGLMNLLGLRMVSSMGARRAATWMQG